MSKTEKSLFEKLEKYSSTQDVPMHMPGHKRNVEYEYLDKLGSKFDITEINGFDDLHNSIGVLRDTCELASKIWGSSKSFLLVNGSTCGILAGIRAVTNYDDKVLVARNCHKSVYHAVELCGLKCTYLLPPCFGENNLCGSITAQSVEQALKEDKEIKLVIITSPTYEGIISNVKEIADVCHKNNVLLLVDEAHGSHLNMCPDFSGGAVLSGADIVIQSLHKTLPSLTQTAIMHINGSICDVKDLGNKIETQLDVFETSSPSYILMASADGCIRLINEDKELFKKWSKNLDKFYNSVNSLKKIKVYNKECYDNLKEVYSFDKSKIVISTAYTNISGKLLMQILREKYNIELEMSLENYAIAMTGLLESSENLERLSHALKQIDEQVVYCKNVNNFENLNIPEKAFELYEIRNKKSEFIDLENAQGRESGEYVYAYPPGIPIVVPGEIISDKVIDKINQFCSNNENVISTKGLLPKKISVII